MELGVSFDFMSTHTQHAKQYTHLDVVAAFIALVAAFIKAATVFIDLADALIEFIVALPVHRRLSS